MKDELCSTYCGDNKIPIIGTGRKPEGIFGGYILVVYPTMWEAKIDLQEGLLSQLSGKIRQHTEQENVSFRLQAVRDEENFTQNGKITLVIHRWNTREREQYSYSSEMLIEKISSLLFSQSEDEREHSSIKRDILVCVHSQRDLCCGRFGTPIYKELNSAIPDSTTQISVKIWRSSHITGHRAAPVLLDLPSGNYWGYVTTELSVKLLNHRVLSPEEVSYHFRGGSDLTPHEQVVDREGFVTYGWEWFEHPPRIKEEDSEETKIIEITRGQFSIKLELESKPGYIEIGETRCGYTKGASTYTIINPL